jgi:hypothetical protein
MQKRENTLEFSDFMKTIQGYYKHSLASAKGNLGRRGDSYLSATETEELVDFYYSMYKLPTLSLINNGEPRVIPEDASSKYDSMNSAKVTIRFDVEKEEKADLVVKLDTSVAQENKELIGFDENGFFIEAELSPANAKQEVDNYKQIITELVAQKNAEVKRENEKLRQQLAQNITEKKSKINAQKGVIKQLAEIIPLAKREQPISPVVPLAKKKKVRINPPKPRVTTYPKIDKKILSAIIDVLVRGGRTFEQAPETFLKLDEEDLRNILISFLNGNFELHAVAEAFNKLGKTDISLRYSGDNLFIAECKFWRGLKLHSDTIDQLFRYLTWRENIGVIITFVKEKGFTDIIRRAKQASSSHETFLDGSMSDRSDSYFVSRHRFPEDEEKTVEIHHLLFTIHSPRV